MRDIHGLKVATLCHRTAIACREVIVGKIGSPDKY